MGAVSALGVPKAAAQQFTRILSGVIKTKFIAHA